MKFGIRWQGPNKWFRNGYPEWVQKEGRTLFESRALAYFWAARILEASMIPGLRVVRVVRKEKAVSKDSWQGRVVDDRGALVVDNRSANSVEAFLASNVGKRVRVTLEVLP